MKTCFKLFFLLIAGFLLIYLAGCASGPSNVHYGASVHYGTGWGYYDGYRPPHYRPPPPHRPPPSRPPPSRPPRPTQLPSGGRR